MNRHITIVGGARSGLAVAKLLSRKGAKVFLTEQKKETSGIREALQAAEVPHEFGGHTSRVFDADFFVISPGVPSTASIVQQAIRKKIPVYAEIEVASWFCKVPMIAITGSNGKTTTTSLIGHIFKTAQRSYMVGGNIGYPFSDYVAGLSENATAILEISSFQLDHIDTFKPKVSLLLNITPDHLDRYNYDFNLYAQSKIRIFKNQQEGDVVVYNHDDELVRTFVLKASEKQKFTAIGFSIEQELEQGAFIRDNTLIFRINKKEEMFMRTEDLALRGQHNLYNSLAAAVAARVMEIRSDIVRESLMTFEGVPHRLEFVRELEGIKFYNDSKATNVNSVWYALESFHEPLILIAGGRDKGNDYTPLRNLVRNKVKVLIGLGEESGKKVIESLGDVVPHTIYAKTMEEAISKAYQQASRGDVVLLSPACASFDMFDNYEERGDIYKRLVANL